MDPKTNYTASSKPKGVCEKLFTVIRTTSPFRIIRLNSHQHRKDAAVASSTPPHVSLMAPPWLSSRFARVSKQPLTSGTAPNRSSHLKPKANSTNGSEKPLVLPIYGQENRAPTIVENGHVIPGSVNINGMFSEFIDRTRQKFHSVPSMVGTEDRKTK